MSDPSRTPHAPAPELPLTRASARLRGRPGRPRKHPRRPTRNSMTPRIASPVLPPLQPTGVPSGSITPVHPRLLTLEAASSYLALSPWLVRELVASGSLHPVHIPLPPDRRGRRRSGVIRKLLFDRADLDDLIDSWKEQRDPKMARRAPG